MGDMVAKWLVLKTLGLEVWVKTWLGWVCVVFLGQNT